MRLFPVTLALAVAAQMAPAQTTVDRTIPLNADGAIRIYALAGTVTVRAWDRESVTIRGTLGAGNRLHAGGGRTAIKAFVESSNEEQPEPSTLEIMVPARAKVWIKTATAGIVVSGVTGSLDAYAVGGAIRVTGNPADVNAEAIDGDIEVIGNPGWVRAKSASGSVLLRGSSPDATLTSVTGRVVIDGKGGGPRFERARFETVTGDIRFAGGIERGADIRFDSHGGTIDVMLARDASADLDVSTISGRISNAFSSARPVSGRYGRGFALTTSAGDGGARLSVRTFKGNITLRRST
ncbi:MAG TPA: DUF4097 family beta strand repeat-containing protein [Gemmatimonadaceae bacterium]